MTVIQQDTRPNGIPAQDQPYAIAAQLYLDKGWYPLPLPAGQKKEPPGGYTGEKGAKVRQPDVDRWIANNPSGNIGLRMPLGVITPDVDCYDGKQGAQTLAALIEQYGALPPTWSSTSREDGSRQCFYRLPSPAQAVRLPGDLGPGVEILQHHHRYAVVWPSTHPDTGRTYRWYRPDGSLADPGEIPAVRDLPLLPEEWWEAKGLHSGLPGGHRHGEAFTDEIVDTFLENGLPRDSGHDDHLARFTFRMVQRGLTDLQVKVMWQQVISVTAQKGNFRQVEGKPYGFSDVDFERHLQGARRKLGRGLTTRLIDWANNTATADELDSIRDENDAPGEKPKVPDPREPLPVARRLSARWKHIDGAYKLMHWRGEWHAWTGTHWRVVSDQNTRTKLYAILEHCVYEKTLKDGMPFTAPWNPTSTTISSVVDALTAISYVDEQIEEGDWIDGRESPRLIPLHNGLLDHRKGSLHRHTPKFLCHYSLPFSYDDAAQCPNWLAFLESVWPADEESKGTLQEWFGYVLSGRTDLQKMLFIIGPTRCGKGTIGRALTALLSMVNVLGLSLNSFTPEFGLSGMVGKPLAIVADARNSKATNMQVVTERILNIVGEDPMSINRKHKDPWEGRLPTRLMMMSNELPNFRDASEAITKRMIVLSAEVSFLGREDTTLDNKIASELPGLLNWALQGLKRLEERGRFVEPAASAGVRENLDEAANPLGVFTEEKLSFREGATVKVSDVFAAYNQWAGKTDGDRAAMTQFGINLSTATGGKLRKVKKMVGGERTYYYMNVELVADPLSTWAQQVHRNF
jgi:putative DNA primase/helicase